MKLYIWGTGKIASEYIQCGEIDKDSVIGFIETKKTKDVFWDKAVYEPQEIVDVEYDYIIVCVCGFEQEIYQIAKAVGFDINKFIFLNNWK